MKELFLNLAGNYTSEEDAERVWNIVNEKYAEPHRAYHTMEHIRQLFEILKPLSDMLENGEAILWATFYHDVIYDPLARDNEAQSAQLAEEHLKRWYVPEYIRELVTAHILATQSHDAGVHPDTAFFTDADLGILAAESEIYRKYALAIRQEYAVYPDELYIPGRIGVLSHFLEHERIYATTYFSEKWENQARKNLLSELQRLQSGQL